MRVGSGFGEAHLTKQLQDLEATAVDFERGGTGKTAQAIAKRVDDVEE